VGGHAPGRERDLFAFLPAAKIDVLPPSSRRQATAHWAVAFDRSNPSQARKMTTRWVVIFLAE